MASLSTCVTHNFLTQSRLKQIQDRKIQELKLKVCSHSIVLVISVTGLKQQQKKIWRFSFPALPAILFAKYSECEQALDLADAQVVQDISCQGHYPCLSISKGHETRSQNIERKHISFLF